MDNFTLFAHLPVELRLEIWRSTLPGPRNVWVKIRFKNSGFGGWMARRSSPPPVALKVCHESREEALKYYILSFGTTDFPPTIYFNHEIDTLCFGNEINLHRLPGSDPNETSAGDYLLNIWVGKYYNPRGTDFRAIQVRKVRFMRLDVEETLYSRPFLWWDEIRRFEGLQELNLVVWDADERASELMAVFRAVMIEVAEANPGWVVPKTTVVSAWGRKWGSLQLEKDASL